MNKILLILFFISTVINAQENNTKKNHIIYADLFMGLQTSGFFSGGSLNYQQKKQLFTLRITESIDLKTAYFFGFPFVNKEDKNIEFATLYGYRKLYDNFSFSVSTGISYNSFRIRVPIDNEFYYLNKDTYLALPFEFNIKWFKRKKRKFKIYYLIPVGKKTSFGSNFGFKVIGNVSKRAYLGLGIVIGFGNHKRY
ncbi:MAG: hypothetical protein V3U80_05235 [Flavobacteriaceae bacterium]